MKLLHSSTRLAVGALCVASAAFAQQRRVGSDIRISKEAPVVSKTVPAGIAALMASGDSIEIQIGHLAHEKGTDKRVRDFGTMLADDHTAHLTRTWEVINDGGVGIAPSPDSVEATRLREMLAWLQSNPAGGTWDATMLRQQAQHHQKVIDTLQLHLASAPDDALAAHIRKSLTLLSKHRDMARSIATTLGVSP